MGQDEVDQRRLKVALPEPVDEQRQDIRDRVSSTTDDRHEGHEPDDHERSSELQNRATEPRSQARRREGSRQEPDRKRNEGETGGASAPRQPGLEIFGQEQQERSQPGEEG